MSWKQIKGYEGIYEINEIGEVKSLERYSKDNRKVAEKILHPIKRGERYVYGLSNGGKLTQHYMHILIADTFNREIPFINFQDEVWKPVENSPIYEISNYGRFRNKKAKNYNLQNCTYTVGAIIKASDNGHGYKSVVRLAGISGIRYIHRMVAEAFLPKPYGKTEVNHINGIKSDNRTINLEWVSKSENTMHAITNMLNPTGSRHFNATLTHDEVLSLREEYQQGTGSTELMNEYGVSRHTVLNVARHKSYLYD